MIEFNNKKVAVFILVAFAIFFTFYFLFFSSPQPEGETVRIVISLKEKDSANYAVNFLYNEKAIRSIALALYGLSGEIQPGAYVIGSGANAFAFASELRTPDEKWVIIHEGLRKEEIGEAFAQSLGWSKDESEKWVSEYTAVESDYFEGVYFPDTYLIPIGDSPERVAERMIGRFNEKFEPYVQEFLRRNIKWTTGLKIASLVQREAASEDDMPLIAGILWNRLFNGMKLDVDATLQYARGDTGSGWWAPITKDDKKLDSPYNTYMYEGLPPHPIANPGIDAIDAALYYKETEHFFYLHGSDGQIHCAKTYEEHLSNIYKYLR